MINIPYHALVIANYIVYTHKCDISNFKLQKILYLIQFLFFKRHGKDFFSNSIEMWRDGPCIPDVYFMFTSFGLQPLSVRDIHGIRATNNILDAHKKFIDAVVEKYSKMSDFALTYITKYKCTFESKGESFGKRNQVIGLF